MVYPRWVRQFVYVPKRGLAYCSMSRLQRVKRCTKETACCKRVLVVTELLNIAVNDFDAKTSARCNRTRCKRGLVSCTL